MYDFHALQTLLYTVWFAKRQRSKMQVMCSEDGIPKYFKTIISDLIPSGWMDGKLNARVAVFWVNMASTT